MFSVCHKIEHSVISKKKVNNSVDEWMVVWIVMVECTWNVECETGHVCVAVWPAGQSGCLVSLRTSFVWVCVREKKERKLKWGCAACECESVGARSWREKEVREWEREREREGVPRGQGTEVEVWSLETWKVCEREGKQGSQLRRYSLRSCK